MLRHLIKVFIGVTYASVIFTTVSLVLFRLVSDDPRYLSDVYLAGLLIWVLLFISTFDKVKKKRIE